MLAAVASCRLVKADTPESVYVDDIISIIQGKIKYYSYSVSSNLTEVVASCENE
jgi:hypothetical protein